MTRDDQAVAAERGKRILNAALIAVGHPPLERNDDFSDVAPAIWQIPTIALNSAGKPPYRFVLGWDIDVWVGPFSEFLVLPVDELHERETQASLERLLQSDMTCTPKRFGWFELLLLLNGVEPWNRLRVRPLSDPKPLASRYEAYARAEGPTKTP